MPGWSRKQSGRGPSGGPRAASPVDGGDNLQAGAQIATVEARHASYLNLINGDSPFPTAFDEGKKPSEIFAAAKPFIVSCPDEVTALFSRLP